MSLDTLLSILFLLVFIVLPLLSRAFRQGPSAGRGGQPRADRGQRPGGPPDQNAPQQQRETPPWLAEAQRRVREAQAQPGGERPTDASTAPRERPLVPQDPFGRREPSADGGTLVPQDPFGSGEPPAAERTLVPDDPFGRPAEPPAAKTLVPDDAVRDAAEPRPGTLVPDDPYRRGLAGGQPPGAGHPEDSLGREGVPIPNTDTAKPPSVSADQARTAAARSTGGPRRSRSLPEHAGSTSARGVAAGLVMAAYVRRRRGHGGARLRPVDLLRFDRRAVVSGLIWHEILEEPAWKRRHRRAPSRPRSR